MTSLIVAALVILFWLGLCQESQNQNQCGSKGESKSRKKLVLSIEIEILSITIVEFFPLIPNNVH